MDEAQQPIEQMAMDALDGLAAQRAGRGGHVRVKDEAPVSKRLIVRHQYTVREPWKPRAAFAHLRREQGGLGLPVPRQSVIGKERCCKPGTFARLTFGKGAGRGVRAGM
jgi:hypothetical protein